MGSPTRKTRFSPSGRRPGGNRLVVPPQALPVPAPGSAVLRGGRETEAGSGGGPGSPSPTPAPPPGRAPQATPGLRLGSRGRTPRSLSGGREREAGPGEEGPTRTGDPLPRNRTRASGSDSSLAQLPLPHPPPPPRYGPERLLELRRSGGPRRRPEPWTAALWVKAPRASCPAAPSSAALASPGVGPEIGWRPLTPPAWPPVLWGPQPPNGGLAQSSMAADGGGTQASPEGPASSGGGGVWAGLGAARAICQTARPGSPALPG